MSGSIRQRAEEAKHRHWPEAGVNWAGIRSTYCSCGGRWPCPDRIAADDTITDLNNAAMVEWFPEGWCLMSDSHPRDTHRVIPDPLPAASGSGAQTTPDQA